jgi:hypothetical protein
MPATALAEDIGKDPLSDLGHADGGVEERLVAVLLVGPGGADVRMQVGRVPPAVRCEPPSVALEVLAQNTPHCPDMSRPFVASQISPTSLTMPALLPLVAPGGCPNITLPGLEAWISPL